MRLWAALLLALTLIGSAAPSFAGPPELPKASGEKCLAEPAAMRRTHMTMLLHRRDATMHQGVRATANGLKACLDCHAVSGTDGQPVGIDSDKHFCRVCHDYAAVSVDCFECHNPRPEPKRVQAAMPETTPSEETVPAQDTKPEGPQ
ncbi:MAG: Hdr-like menaquinol oxidoreductase cytochrome c subunit [Alphaproteobacteria bacterium]|nr:Hdr-like menaquinol oxidoreductase cytochrome c subunit [Alphaproteobacteria bacterium]